MPAIARLKPQAYGREPLTCRICGRPVRMRQGHLLTCECGAAPPNGCWTQRAMPDTRGNGAPLVYLERYETARKPCSNLSCNGCMVFSAKAIRRSDKRQASPTDRVRAWTCGRCGRQDIVDEHD